MSDKRETKEKPLIILQNAENYPTWKSYTISLLQQQSCDWAIKRRPQSTLDSVWAGFIEDGFDAADVRTNMLVSSLRDEKKDYLIAPTKSAGIIKELVDENLQPLLSGKTAQDMWAILEARFQHISPMSVIRVFSDAFTIKLSECKDVLEYISRYQIAFVKIMSLITKNGLMSQKTVEMTLQGNLLRHLGKENSALVSGIETEWKEETTNFSDTILRLMRHAEINKENAQDVAENTKVLTIITQRALKGTCTTPE